MSWLTDVLGIRELPARLGERRLRDRLATGFEAVLITGGAAMRVRGANIDRHGAGIEAGEPLTVGSEIFVRLTSMGLAGFASVRHCTQIAVGKYRIGIRFRDRLVRNDAVPGVLRHAVCADVRGWDEPAS